MVENTFTQLVLERMGMSESQLSKPRIASFIGSTLQTLANRIADHTINRPVVRELLRKDFSISVGAGVGSLASAMSATEALLTEFARGWVVTSTSDLTLGRPYPYSYVADRASFQHDRPKGLGYFTVDGTSLLVMTTTGNRANSGTYIVHANYVPTLASLPDTLTDDVLNVAVELIRMGMPAPPEPASATEEANAG
jgi:hypothetical protein